jgi:lipoate-protein ligase B
MSERRKLRVAELGLVEYGRALALQERLVAARIADEVTDTMLMLEHPPVFTLGRGADERFILAQRDDVPVHRVSRGGQVTFHGPGQLVAYPIIKLDGRARDVSGYLRGLEAAIIRSLAHFGIEAHRRAGLTGVWIGSKKIASIGVGIRRWVTYHGLAVNVATDLSYFDAIVPCGIDGCEMTSVAAQGRNDIGVEDFAAALRAAFAEHFGYDLECGIEPLQTLFADGSLR